jgi:hypothetical protein
MKKWLYSSAAVVLAAVSLIAQTGAHASPGAAGLAFVGTGTFSPGLTTTPTPTSVTMSGTATGFIVAVPGASAGSYTCNFSGGSTIAETAAVGAGVLTGTCSGSSSVTSTSGGVNCTIVWVRVGMEWVQVWTCQAMTSGLPTTRSPGGTTNSMHGVGVGQLVPDELSPITSFKLAIGVAMVGAD